MVIRVIVQDAHHVLVSINRHVLTTRAVLIVEKVKTRAVSVPRALAQAYRAVLPSPGSTVSHAMAIVLAPVIIREKNSVSSHVMAIVPVLSLVSRVRANKAAISPVAVTSPVEVISPVRAAINPVVVTSLVVAINSVLSLVSRVRANKVNMVSPAVAISPVRVVTSPVAAISLVSRAVISPVVAISRVSQGNSVSRVVAMLLSAVALRSNVVPTIPMRSIR